MKLLRPILILLLTGSAVALTAWFYVNKSHRNIEAETALYSVSVDTILTQFQQNESESFQKYFDQVIIVEGMLEQVIESENSVKTVILYGIKGITICELSMGESIPKDLSLPQPIRVKGLVTGFDDLLGEVKLREGSIVSY